MDTKVIVDRRSRPKGVERRTDPGLMPIGGARGSQIVRSRGGRRRDDEQPPVWPIAAPWMQSVQGPSTEVPTTPYRMPSGQLIG